MKYCAGYVLAGGMSSRFGPSKARALLGGQSMLARMAALVRSAAHSVEVISADEKDYADMAIPFVKDIWPGEGPLGGVVTALVRNATRANASGNELRPDQQPGIPQWNLIVGCDMPFLTSEWLRFLVEQAFLSEAQAVVARSAHGVEPLCACWTSDAASVLQPAFEGGMRRVNDGLKLLRTEVLDEPVWKRFDSDGRLFWNMNTPEDYEAAIRIVESQKP